MSTTTTTLNCKLPTHHILILSELQSLPQKLARSVGGLTHIVCCTIKQQQQPAPECRRPPLLSIANYRPITLENLKRAALSPAKALKVGGWSHIHLCMRHQTAATNSSDGAKCGPVGWNNQFVFLFLFFCFCFRFRIWDGKGTPGEVGMGKAPQEETANSTPEEGRQTTKTTHDPEQKRPDRLKTS